MKKKYNLAFFNISKEYIEYLKRFDDRVPDVEYVSHNKFLCGVLFKRNGLDYFAPISSYNAPTPTNYLIKVGGCPIGSIRMSYMIPVPKSEVKIKQFSLEKDKAYRYLLFQELKYCENHEVAIHNKAKRIYKNAIQYHDPNCCDFRLLENKCNDWIIDKGIKALNNQIPLRSISIQEKIVMAKTTKSMDLLHRLSLDASPLVRKEVGKNIHTSVADKLTLSNDSQEFVQKSIAYTTPEKDIDIFKKLSESNFESIKEIVASKSIDSREAYERLANTKNEVILKNLALNDHVSKSALEIAYENGNEEIKQLITSRLQGNVLDNLSSVQKEERLLKGNQAIRDTMMMGDDLDGSKLSARDLEVALETGRDMDGYDIPNDTPEERNMGIKDRIKSAENEIANKAESKQHEKKAEISHVNER